MDTLKEKALAYIEKAKDRGTPTGSYACPSCKSLLATTVPSRDGDVWDSATECYECGRMHFVTKTISGITVSELVS